MKAYQEVRLCLGRSAPVGDRNVREPSSFDTTGASPGARKLDEACITSQL
jgi:hypothetical protein